MSSSSSSIVVSVSDPSRPAIHDGATPDDGPNHSSSEDSDVDAEDGDSIGGDAVETGDETGEEDRAEKGSSACDDRRDTGEDPTTRLVDDN